MCSDKLEMSTSKLVRVPDISSHEILVKQSVKSENANGKMWSPFFLANDEFLTRSLNSDKVVITSSPLLTVS